VDVGGDARNFSRGEISRSDLSSGDGETKAVTQILFMTGLLDERAKKY
jgi:hypothetical protein